MINWTVRFKNKLWLTTLLATLVTFVYDILALFDIIPPIGEDLILSIVETVLTSLVLVGVIVDPTTKGMWDSTQALTYVEPK